MRRQRLLRVICSVMSAAMIFTSMPAMGVFAEDSVDMSELIEEQEISEEEESVEESVLGELEQTSSDEEIIIDADEMVPGTSKEAAVALELGKVYSYDFKGAHSADIQIPETRKKYYCKFTVNEAGNYVTKLQVSSEKEAIVNLIDSEEAKKAFVNHKHETKNAQISAEAGAVYYATIELYDNESTGYIYLGTSADYKDPEYDTSEKVNGGEAKGLAGTANYMFAPRLALNQAYTIDYAGKEGANLSWPEKHKDYYYKLIVEEKGSYYVNFKHSTKSSSQIVLQNSDYENTFGYNMFNPSNETFSKIVDLTPGVYYIGVENTGDGDSCGSLYVGAKDKYVDPEFDTSEKINDSDVKGLNGAVDYCKAPRIAVGKKYTLDFFGKNDANLSAPEKDKDVFYKVLVTEDGTYSFNYQITSKEKGLIKLMDGDYNKVADKNESVKLTKGVYYILFNAKDDNTTATVELNSKSGNNAVEVTYSVSYNGLENAKWEEGVEVPTSFVWKNKKMKTVKLPTAKQITREGYKFAGWYYTDDKGKERKLTKITKKITGDLTLTAKWNENKYNIVYKITKPEGVKKCSYEYGTPDNKKPKKEKHVYSDKITLPTGIKCTDKEGNTYTLVKWKLVTKNAPDTFYEPGQSIEKFAGKEKSGKTVKLIAEWK